MIILCQLVIIACALVCLVIMGIIGSVAVVRAILGVETLTRKKIMDDLSYEQGVPDQISNVMWRRGSPLIKKLSRTDKTKEEEEEED